MCIYVHTCVCIYIYIYTCMYVYISLSLSLSLSLSFSIYIYIYIYIFNTYIHIGVCTYVLLHYSLPGCEASHLYYSGRDSWPAVSEMTEMRGQPSWRTSRVVIIIHILLSLLLLVVSINITIYYNTNNNSNTDNTNNTTNDFEASHLGGHRGRHFILHQIICTYDIVWTYTPCYTICLPGWRPAILEGIEGDLPMGTSIETPEAAWYLRLRLLRCY